MIHIKLLVFNAFQVNTWILYDDTAEAIIVDAGCSNSREERQVSDFMRERKLKLIRNIDTHCHIDHMLGNDFIAKTYQVHPEYNEAGIPFFSTSKEVAASFGFTLNGIPKPAGFIKEDDVIRFGSGALQVLYTPGHADGSVCLYCKQGDFVLSGDVLFRDSIGRTDLPTGNFDLLIRSIREKLFTLPDETVVYPGHGPETSIGYEKRNNPFII